TKAFSAIASPEAPPLWPLGSVASHALLRRFGNLLLFGWLRPGNSLGSGSCQPWLFTLFVGWFGRSRRRFLFRGVCGGGQSRQRIHGHCKGRAGGRRTVGHSWSSRNRRSCGNR